MVKIKNNYSEFWNGIPWKQLRRNLFRLQCRIWKAIRANDKLKAKKLQKLLLRSRSARLLAIRQVTQLNQGKKTAGVDGKAKLSFRERLELDEVLRCNWFNWKHQGLREIPIPKKDGTTRMLKVPTMADRAWQCLLKYALEPAHEATFHPNSYGFRPGRSTHDAQKHLFNELRSNSNGIQKRVLELDIEKCFDRINHSTIVGNLIAPNSVKLGLWRCLKAGINPEFPSQGTPQGGVVSPLLANIALNGIEEIHTSIRYADDMVFILKPKDDAEAIRRKVDEFLAQRGLKVKEAKTRLVNSTDGFNFLGWHYSVKPNGKFLCVPSEENYRAFKSKVKEVINSSNYGAVEKTKKLAPIVRGWLNYHKFCDMGGLSGKLWKLKYSTFRQFLKEKTMNRTQAEAIAKKAYPNVGYKVNGHIKVKGNATPYNGDITYWSKRNSKLYDGMTAKTLNKQGHKCGYCGLKMADGEKIHLHHIDGNHDNWKLTNLVALHESCHDYVHSSKQS